MSITNAERIAQMITKAPKSVIIHTVPQSNYWIVMFKTKTSDPNWRCVLCNPELTTWRLVTENITPDEHWNLFNELVKTHVQSKLTHYLDKLRKQTTSFKCKNKKIPTA